MGLLTPEEELLAALRAQGRAVTLVGEALHVRPGSRMPEELRAALRAHKAEVMALLRGERKRCAICWRLFPSETLSRQEGLGTWWRCLNVQECAAAAAARTARERQALRRIGLG
jgi:TubC N-terminal docking domain